MSQPFSLASILLGFIAISGLNPAVTAEVPAPTLIDMQVEPIPAVDPAAPTIDQLEIKVTRSEALAINNYSIALQGTLARPDGLDHAYGPLAWSVVAAHDTHGNSMRFTTEGYTTPDVLLNEPVAELYRRLGPTMVRVNAQRLSFNVHLKNLDYLTPRFERLAIRSYAILAEDEQAIDVELPTTDGSVDVAEAWVLTVQAVGDRQELQLRAHDPEPSVWPLRLELIDAEGNVISTGYRRGTTTLDNTLATQWRFSQPTLTPNPAASPETETQDPSENEPAPTWRLRIHHATGLGIKQLDAVLGEVQLIDLTAPAEAEADPSLVTD
ncbi:MAG: hypothetical protein AAF911_12195 [Planctomycetota bacterium]